MRGQAEEGGSFLGPQIAEEFDHFARLARVGRGQDGPAIKVLLLGLPAGFGSQLNRPTIAMGQADDVLCGEDSAGAFTGQQQPADGADSFCSLGRPIGIEARDDVGSGEHIRDDGELLVDVVVEIHVF